MVKLRILLMIWHDMDLLLLSRTFNIMHNTVYFFDQAYSMVYTFLWPEHTFRKRGTHLFTLANFVCWSLHFPL